ncbi:uncharacterized protein LOC125191870 isoform X2 [Salvia hispanica]|uniref:uncharacterized protein LOC125191870 isoform X2 n=1 Tax=Salvia hispanica TaxID=49212 RepID=UPI0020097390|nr:uncharacterized protein LOC125191870 isoform X2 [Salvia hispanica]
MFSTKPLYSPMAKPSPVFLLSVAPPPLLCRPSPFIFHTRFLRRRIHGRRARIRAVGEWQDYEEAVKKKDLAGALRFLRLKDELQTSSIESIPQSNEELRLFEIERDFQVLNTCLNADDMRLVGTAYGFLKDRGLLANFGKYRNIVLGESREVTPSVLKSSTGLEAYLMGCPIRGVILDPIRAMQMGIQGQAGTQFWDEKLQHELSEGRLSGSAFDRYCMVLFAGIAAEALIYGEAEGGENDENLFRSICGLLEPPFTIAQMSNQARWSVLQSYNLLKLHKAAHRAAFIALESGGELSLVIRRIEEAMSST